MLTGEIEVTQTLTISANTTLQGGSLKRAANFTGTMLQVNSGTLTLQDITVDGNAVANSNYMLLVKNAPNCKAARGKTYQRQREWCNKAGKRRAGGNVRR